MRLFAPKRSLPVSLHLLEPTIYLEPTGDHPSVLRGVLNVSSKDFMARIKSVHLCIKGRLTTCSKEQRILDKQISCYRKAEKFAFELQLPIDLPDTITCSDIKVEYEVVASVIHGDSRKKNVITLKQPVRLARLPFKTLMLAGDNVTWIDSQPQSALDILEYRMLIEKRFLSLGSQFPLSIWIAPKVQGLRIVCISAQLIERRRIYGNTQRQHSHFLVRCMADPETLPQSDIDMPWQGTFQYKLPDDMVVPSSRYKRVYCIEHALQVSLLVTHPTGSDQRVHKSITFETDIDLLDQSVGALERSLQLPTYDNARPRRRPSELEKMASIICAPSPPIYDDVVRPPSYASPSVQVPPTAS